MNKKFAFISRHQPTDEQRAIAANKGIELVVVGDADGFSFTHPWVDDKGDFEGVVVFDPGAALSLAPYFVVGVFENSNRAPEGQPPIFIPKELHLYDLRG